MKKRFSILGFVIVYVFTVGFGILQNPQTVYAARGDNALKLMGERCEKFKKDENFLGSTSDKWQECNGYQNAMEGNDDTLQCSDRMFYQKTDSQDTSAKIDEWYTNAQRYADCYNKAKSKLNQLASNKCKNLIRNSPNWKDCANIQLRLDLALGCAEGMFEENSNGKWNIPASRLNDCKNKLKAAGQVRILNADGSRAPAPYKANDENQGDGTAAGGADALSQEDGNDEVDCDLQFSSPPSWFICPLIDLGVNMTDTVFQNIIKPMLENVPVSADPEKGVYIAWQQFRLIANVLLVGSLLVIVYSQARGGK